MTQRDDGLQQNTYFIDAESGTELARLQLQDRLINQHLGGPLPALGDLSGVHDVSGYCLRPRRLGA